MPGNQEPKNRRGRLLPAQETAAFCRQISLLAEAGIPLAEGLDSLQEEAAGHRERELLRQLQTRLEEHVPLSQALEESGSFPAYVCRMAAVGEETGLTDQIMRGLARHYEQEAELSASLRSATFYPSVMTVILFAVLFFLAEWVMPIFEGVFAQLGAGLSPLTLGVIRGIGIFSGIGLAAVLLLALAVVLLRRYRGGELWNRLTAGWKISRLRGEYRLAEVLAMALRCGMDLEQGLDMAKDLVGNRIVRSKLLRCRERLGQGESFADIVADEGLFRPMQRQMIRLGLRTGRSDELLGEIAAQCGREADEAIDRILARLEPALTAVMSLAAGAMLVMVMLPLIGVLSSIG